MATLLVSSCEERKVWFSISSQSPSVSIHRLTPTLLLASIGYWDHKVTEAPHRMDISLPFSVWRGAVVRGVVLWHRWCRCCCGGLPCNDGGGELKLCMCVCLGMSYSRLWDTLSSVVSLNPDGISALEPFYQQQELVLATHITAVAAAAETTNIYLPRFGVGLWGNAPQ